MASTHLTLSNGTLLADRFLFHDGDSVFNPDDLENLILSGVKCNRFVTELNDEIIQMNKSLSPNDKIKIKTELNELNLTWNIPKKYKNVNLMNYLVERFKESYQDYDESETKNRYNRMVKELIIFKKLNLLDFLKTLIYIVDKFEENNIIWGVGRGSSVSSYILFLIGIHDIDSYKYELNFNDFLEI